jgi:hypothetical protein
MDNVTLTLAKQSSGGIVQQHCQHPVSTAESRDESNENFCNPDRSFACCPASARPGQR